MDHFDAANAAANRCARKILKRGIPPTIAADALIETGLAVWAAAKGRSVDATDLLRVWAAVRDGEPD